MEIRRLTLLSDFEQVISLQRSIWQMSDLEIQPTDTFAVADKIGGEVLGAFVDSFMVGFCLGLPGLKEDGMPFLHSHMLGVLPEYTNQGIGRALKYAQRMNAMSRGINLIEWTFDPLQIKNTFFNTERLGAVVRRCYYNFYGKTSNALDSGLPTDRCVAEWWLRSARVRSIVDRCTAPQEEVTTSIRVPVTSHLRAVNPSSIRDVQKRVMADLSKLFADGLSLIGVERSPDSALYLFGQSGSDDQRRQSTRR